MSEYENRTNKNEPRRREFAGEMSREEKLAQLQLRTRRHFLRSFTAGLGGMFLGTLASPYLRSAQAADLDSDGTPRLDFTRDLKRPLEVLPPEFPGRAKRVIYLHMAGAPSQLELFDHKPELTRLDGQDCPASFLVGKRFAFISGAVKMLGPQYPFHQAGKSGQWISDRLPHIEKHIDEICFIKSMRTDEFNHAPAQLLLNTGNARFGYPSFGSWVLYGLGTENQNLPGFIVFVSGMMPDAGKQMWGSGYLPGVYQGVQCRDHGEPVLYLDNPSGVSRPLRRTMLDTIDAINERTYAEFGNPETVTRIAQYEMAFRMQLGATDAMDIQKEPESIRESYGVKPGESCFANNCLMARRLAERGVRFIQLYHEGWDSHGSSAGEALNIGFMDRCREVDQPIAALLTDLKQRGMMEDTLVVWGGEFGRTSMRENRNGQVIAKFVGRDHNPSAFTIWMAGAGVKPGMTYGQTDEMGYEIVKDPVDIRDLHATMLCMLGFDHRKLTYPFQGLNQKLTGVKSSRVVAEVLA